MNTTDIQHLRRFKKLFSCLALSVAFLPISCNHADPLEKEFRNPPNKYRPMPFWHLNGHLTKEGINERISNAKSLCGFGGVAVLPVSPEPHYTNGKTCPGMTPAYLSDEYFERYDDMLRKSEELGTEIILYDDIDFPSGSAGGKLVRDYPEYTRKYLLKDEIDVSNCTTFEQVKLIIDDWIDYYNNDRYQWQLAKLSPNEFYAYLTTGIYPLKGVPTIQNIGT